MCQVENNRLLDATIDEVKNSAQDMISHVTKLYNGDSNNNKKVTAWDIADQSVTKAKSYSKNINPKMQSKYYASVDVFGDYMMYASPNLCTPPRITKIV